jgi:hypothetical protein
MSTAAFVVASQSGTGRRLASRLSVEVTANIRAGGRVCIFGSLSDDHVFLKWETYPAHISDEKTAFTLLASFRYREKYYTSFLNILTELLRPSC